MRSFVLLSFLESNGPMGGRDRNGFWASLAACALLAACGGGGGGSSGGATPAPTPPPASAPVTAPEAARFLTQATFGATEATIASLQTTGYANWLTQQMALAPTGSHQTHVETRLAQLRAINPNAQLSPNQFYESFWLQAATGDDQLRQRVKLALSEMFVISLADPNIDVRGAASYYDMLGANAFGNYRNLLELVSLHPMMGAYLTHLANQKEDPLTGRNPDENYAREVMQLMTVGLFQLNADGTVRTNAAGQALATYSPDDVSGLAKVFTGFSWYSPAPSNTTTFFGRGRAADATVRSMIAYPFYHSTSAKSFLGVTIPASATADPAGDLKIALDTLFNHPNTAPFVSRQLIQRLVTSNPRPGSVGRVAAIFVNNGSGVRGDLAAVVRAVLTDAEARDGAVVNSATFGKLREPLVRMGNWMRAFGARSASGNWLIASTSANTSLSQSALAAPSVFNFFRPGYSPPNTRIGQQNLVAPEFQIVDEVSTAGYLNTMQTAINTGIGTANDVTAPYTAEAALANDASALVDRMSLLLMYGTMSSTLKGRIVEAVNSAPLPAATDTNQAQVAAARLNRAKVAVLLTMSSPEYLAQR